MDQKLDILSVVSRYTNLKRQGRESCGLCPFREEKNPSFTVSEEKGLWHCFGCAEGGDVIRFIEKVEGLDFKGALAYLGIADQPRPAPEVRRKRDKVKETSARLTAWLLRASNRISVRMREVGQQAHLSRELLGTNKELLRWETERVSREWAILKSLQEDLLNTSLVFDLWQERDAIIKICGDENDSIESPDYFPPLTETYRMQLQAFVKGDS